MCAHFRYSRSELFTIGKIKQLKTFESFILEAGAVSPSPSDSEETNGCEVCKPAIASILAGLWNEHILNPGLRSLQDTNDRYLANIQRGGLYSIIPRIAAGEVTPQKLSAIADVATEYNLYTKIHLGEARRCRVREWPCIWKGVACREKLCRHSVVSLRPTRLRWVRYQARKQVQGHPIAP